MDNIFIISVSHHIIQLLRAVTYFNLDRSNVQVVVMCTPNNKFELKNKLRDLGFDRVELFEYWTFHQILIGKSVAYIQYLKTIRMCKNLFVSQYSSDYTLIANSILKPSSLYLLDEGTASFLVASKRQNLSKFNWKLSIKSILYRRAICLPKKIIYFTQYNIDKGVNSDEIILYSFDKIINKIIFEKNSILIIGSSIVEVDVVLKKTYMEILHSLKLENENKCMFYFPHRKEDELKLKEIEFMGYTIINASDNFENYFQNLNKTPEVYYSFYSPVLDNLSKMFVNLPRLNMIKLNQKDILKNREIIDDIYNFYSKNNNIHIIDMSL